MLVHGIVIPLIWGGALCGGDQRRLSAPLNLQAAQSGRSHQGHFYHVGAKGMRRSPFADANRSRSRSPQVFSYN